MSCQTSKSLQKSIQLLHVIHNNLIQGTSSQANIGYSTQSSDEGLVNTQTVDTAFLQRLTDYFCCNLEVGLCVLQLGSKTVCVTIWK